MEVAAVEFCIENLVVLARAHKGKPSRLAFLESVREDGCPVPRPPVQPPNATTDRPFGFDRKYEWCFAEVGRLPASLRGSQARPEMIGLIPGGAGLLMACDRSYRRAKQKESAMRHNRLRALLTAGEPSIGTHLLSSWPTLIELVGDAGNYDYVEFTAEYAPFHMHDLDNLGRALELKNLGGMIKIEQTQWTHQAMRAIGSGFQAVLFADLRTVEDARACVAAVRAETPGTGGRLGVGMRRDVGTVLEGGSPAYVAALNDIVIAVMIEKRECVEDLDAILSVKGLDMVQFGPSDYSMSLGLTGQRNHPEVLKAERRTIETALKKGLHPRVELADIKQAAAYLEMGVRHFCIGWDARILFNWWRINGEGMRAMLMGAPSAAHPKRVATTY
ncbi:MAG TPA: aldolase/citrate lyase family protein [Acetobacteraceae bacterium]|jgi:4-hydroxy-2-oxoheptanedioate aldolase